MCVKVIASHRWDVFLRHGVLDLGPDPPTQKDTFPDMECLTWTIFETAIISIHIPETVTQVGQWAWLG